MGNKLKEKQIMPDLILSSPAKRVKETAIKIAKEIGYPKKKIVFDVTGVHPETMFQDVILRRPATAGRRRIS